MTYQSDSLARVRARVTQGFVQGFSRSFLRCCKGCNGSAQPCFTCMCARAHLRMRVGLHETLATLATLAHSKPLSLYFNLLAGRDRARVTQGLGVWCKGSTCDPVSTFPRSPIACPFQRGGGFKSPEGAGGLDRIRCHAGIFSWQAGFSGAALVHHGRAGRCGRLRASLWTIGHNVASTGRDAPPGRMPRVVAAFDGLTTNRSSRTIKFPRFRDAA